MISELQTDYKGTKMLIDFTVTHDRPMNTKLFLDVALQLILESKP